MMPNTVHRVGIENSDIETVYKSIASVEGLKSWWTETVTGESAIHEILNFHFGSGGSSFEVIELISPSLVEWKCVSGPSEWLDTRIQFAWGCGVGPEWH